MWCDVVSRGQGHGGHVKFPREKMKMEYLRKNRAEMNWTLNWMFKRGKSKNVMWYLEVKVTAVWSALVGEASDAEKAG